MFRIARRSKPVSARANEPAVAFEAPQVAPPGLAVIGDVHGEIALLERLLARLADEAPEAHLVFVGDLIDRGERSDAVLDTVYAMRERATVIRGNHEDMLVGFLDDPETAGRLWLRNGGLQTLAAFGIGGVGLSGGDLEAARDGLRARLGPERENWLRFLPRLWQSGNVVVTHAGADPRVSIPGQSPRALTWGHRDFGQHSRRDGLWVVHGHTVVPEPVARAGIISIDTGAYATGRLSALVLDGGGLRFLGVER